MISQYLSYIEQIEPFFGNNFTLERYEILTLSKIPNKERIVEPELMNLKWFDYRLMHPMMATYYFYHEYKKSYKEFWRENINVESSDFAKPNKGGDDFIEFREARAIWRLRQKADALGIKYDFFTRSLFKKSKPMLFRGRVVAPRPSMLSSDELITDVYKNWCLLKREKMIFSELDFFKVKNYTQNIAQNAHENAVIEFIKQRPHITQHYLLDACMHDLEILRVERVLSDFPTDVIKELFFG